MNERILNVKVGEPLESTLARAAHSMEMLERGETPAPYFGVGFSDVAQLFSVFTPRRWDLLAALQRLPMVATTCFCGMGMQFIALGCNQQP